MSKCQETAQQIRIAAAAISLLIGMFFSKFMLTYKVIFIDAKYFMNALKRSSSQNKYFMFGILLDVQNMIMKMFFCPYIERFGIDRVFGMILTR